MLYFDVTADYLLITLGKTQVITTATSSGSEEVRARHLHDK